MRLIETFETERKAYIFYAFLLRQGIANSYEPLVETTTKVKRYAVWIQEEDQFLIAEQWLEKYRKAPENDPLFQEAEQQILKPKTPLPIRKKRGHPVTIAILAICIFLFLWNDMQEAALIREKNNPPPITPLQEAFYFDAPLQQTSQSWKGMGLFFTKARAEGLSSAFEQTKWARSIAQGECWRLFTPCLLHADFLHILFNMAWVWLLVQQVEARLPKWKLLVLVLVLGICSNSAQYIASGPYFLGFSGVIVGLAGFIWMRQKCAPWEGYPLSGSTSVFLLVFVLAMVVLEVVGWVLHQLLLADFPFSVGNTAHVIGGLCGLILGKVPFFSRRAL